MATESKLIVYGLVDPRDGLVHYVGKSMRGMARPREHIKSCHLRETNKKTAWVRELIAAGLQYEIRVLEECVDGKALSVAEVRWIKHGREQGWPLKNSVDIEYSTGGWRLSAETRVKMGVRSRALWQDPELRNRMAEKARAQWQDPTFQAKMSENSRALWQDPELRNRMSENSRALWQDPKYRDNITNGARARWGDAEYRAKMATALTGSQSSASRTKKAASLRARWQDPKYRNKMLATHQGRGCPEETRRKIAEKIRARWQDPKHRSKVLATKSADRQVASAVIRAKWLDPAYRSKVSAGIKKTKSSDVAKKKMSEISRARWQDPNYRDKLSAAQRERAVSPETREKIAEKTRVRWKDPEYRAMISAANEQRGNRKKAEWLAAGLGKDPDEVVARRMGRATGAAEVMRFKLGLSATKSIKGSVAKRAQWQDPEFRAKNLAAQAAARARRKAAKEAQQPAEPPKP